MPDKITIAVDSKQVLDVLGELINRLGTGGIAPALEKIGQDMEESSRARFLTGTAPDNSPWPALKPGTVLARHRMMMQSNDPIPGGTSKPLVRRGYLARSIVHQVSGDTVEIGTNHGFGKDGEISASVHQLGSRDGRIPARPFLGLSNQDEVMVLDILREFLEDAIP